MKMVDENCWFGPGGNKPFDCELNDWENSKLSKRSIYVLRYIKGNSPINLNTYDDNILDYLKNNGVGGKNLTKKHTYGPFLFVNFISKNDDELEITNEGINFLDNIDNRDFENATLIYLDNLFDATFETDATKGIEIKAFPVKIMFKMLYDKQIIPLFMFRTHIQFIKDCSDLEKCLSLLDDDSFFEYIDDLHNSFKQDKDKFISIYKIATDKWKSYVIGCLVSLGIFDKSAYNRGYLKFSDFGVEFVEKKGIEDISYESMFY